MDFAGKTVAIVGLGDSSSYSDFFCDAMEELYTAFLAAGANIVGKVDIDGELRKIDLVDAMIEAANPDMSDANVQAIEEAACPTCGSCSGMFTANSMNCLAEASCS